MGLILNILGIQDPGSMLNEALYTKLIWGWAVWCVLVLGLSITLGLLSDKR